MANSPLSTYPPRFYFLILVVTICFLSPALAFCFTFFFFFLLTGSGRISTTSLLCMGGDRVLRTFFELCFKKLTYWLLGYGLVQSVTLHVSFFFLLLCKNTLLSLPLV